MSRGGGGGGGGGGARAVKINNWSEPNQLGKKKGSCEPAGCRRSFVSLYQPMVLGIANKTAAAVLLSVNRAGQRTTEHGAAPRQMILNDRIKRG
jgi:hypothetical protein